MNTSVSRHISPLLLSALVPFWVSLSACGQEDEATQCNNYFDCDAEQACIQGVCTAGECRTSDDCAEGLECVASTCITAEVAPDAGDAADAQPDDVFMDASPEEVADAPEEVDDAPDSDIEFTDLGPDVDFGPLEFTIAPGDGVLDVPLNAVVTVQFNQPMAELTLIPSNLDLNPWEAEGPYPFVTYDPETFVLTVTPCEGPTPTPECQNVLPLQPSTPYDFALTPFIRSQSGLAVPNGTRVRFYTAGAVGTEYHRALAETYAPVIYQEVEQAKYDTFTDIYFDGDALITNNLESTRVANRGTTYWSVVETTSHFFITYLLYYPGRQVNDVEVAEHDLTGIQVIVEKVAGDPFGRLQAFSTFYRETLGRWAMTNDFYSGGVAPVGGANLSGRLPADRVEGGRRVAVFVDAGNHALCIPNVGLDRCQPASGPTAPFDRNATGVVYRVGPTAQRIGDGPNDALTYSLTSFVDSLWVFRSRTSGADSLFGGRIVYGAPESAPGVLRPGDGITFPSALQSDNDGDSFGDLPFAFGRSTAFPPDYGVWFVDPAFYADQQFELPGSVSVDYCFNPWLNIDNRDVTEGCTPSVFSLP
jgi:hypothetical protein